MGKNGSPAHDARQVRDRALVDERMIGNTSCAVGKSTEQTTAVPERGGGGDSTRGR
jgi:hypothetical protein